MQTENDQQDTFYFLKSLGFPKLRVHHSFNHFDFRRPSRRILVIGPMGSGKTEYSSRVWRDGEVARTKSAKVAALTTDRYSGGSSEHRARSAGMQHTSEPGASASGTPGAGMPAFGASAPAAADRRNVFFIRSLLDAKRFPDYPPDSLAYRGGYYRCGENIARITNSFDFEQVYRDHQEAGTWIIDEASFYDERLVYLVKNESEKRGLIFIFPTLILNFRKDIFNSTARLMIETATDVFPLTAYCEHKDCIEDAFYTYRYYIVDGKECPALYFDPLIIVGGDTEKRDPKEPNYCARCDKHHYLPGKEYTFLVLNPLGMRAGEGDIEPLKKELTSIKHRINESQLYASLEQSAKENRVPESVYMNSLEVSCIAEKALMYVYAEQNLVGLDQVRYLIRELDLDSDYMEKSLADNRRVVSLR